MKTFNSKNKKCKLTEYKKYVCNQETGQGELSVWTKALQTAIDENDYVYIPKGTYYLDESIILSSNKWIKADKKAEIILLESCKKLMLRNADVIDGSFTIIPDTAPKTENIRIEGGIWSESNRCRIGYGRTGKYDDADSIHGVTCTMLFSGVKNLVLQNMVFKHSAGFSIQMGRCENFTVKNIEFISCYADGVHVNGGVRNGYVYNIHGEVGDDLVALNAYDWGKSTINNGEIENVVVEKVYAPTNVQCYKAIRIQPGILPIENGEMDCYVKNLCIKDVKGVSVFKMYLQTPRYVDKPDGVRVGWMENIRFENVEVDAVEPIDAFPNYLTGDPIIGHFAAFELGSNIRDIYFKNVNVSLNKEKYPLSHFVLVGPKSKYMEEEKTEIFDPYVVSKVGKIVCKNVKINNQKLQDIQREICAISFPDDMYKNQFGKGGSGTIGEIIVK
ncbi:MAG: hypothetical protein IJD33_01050 [Clostridia bacterium]|nr:hypothetical protein [Clostridia bacterium]